MKLNKNKAMIAALSITIVIMVIVTFYLRTFLFKDTSSPTVIQNQVKASNQSYEKVLPINEASPTITSLPQQAVNPGELSGTSSPSPTEIVLAYISPTGSLATSSSSLQTTLSPTLMVSQYQSSPSAMVTRLQSLPQTGIITNAVMIIMFASSLIFLSFIF